MVAAFTAEEGGAAFKSTLMEPWMKVGGGNLFFASSMNLLMASLQLAGSIDPQRDESLQLKDSSVC
jgi:hypothetical protein